MHPIKDHDHHRIPVKGVAEDFSIMKWILALFFLSGVGQAQQSVSYTTGNDLQEECRVETISSSAKAYKAGICRGFIEGYMQLAMMVPSRPKLVCLPEHVTHGEVQKVVVKYLDQHPEKLHLPAAQLVYDATNEAFPCPASPK